MDKYAIAEHNEDSDWAEEYSMLKGPNGFECCLTEPEDRMWYRDGAGAIQELNRLLAENERLRAELKELSGQRERGMAAIDKHRCSLLAENERIKEALKTGTEMADVFDKIIEAK